MLFYLLLELLALAAITLKDSRTADKVLEVALYTSQYINIQELSPSWLKPEFGE